MINTVMVEFMTETGISYIFISQSLAPRFAVLPLRCGL